MAQLDLLTFYLECLVGCRCSGVFEGARLIADILDGLAALVNNSLLPRLTDTDAEPRFAMLETSGFGPSITPLLLIAQRLRRVDS